MSNKTRKRIWPVSVVMSIAIIGALAAFLVLAGNPGATQAHEPGDHPGSIINKACADMTDAERGIHDGIHANLEVHGTMDPCPEDDGNGNGNGMTGEREHASMPVMFAAEGLDNTARLNWRQPKRRDPGAEIIGYRIDRDAWNADEDHPVNKYGDDYFYLLNLASVLAVDYTDRGLAYDTAYTYSVRAIVEYDVKHWWNNLSSAMKNKVVTGGGMYDSLNDTTKAAVHRAYGLQAGKYPVSMVDAWWNNLNCAQMNDAVSPTDGEPAVGSDDPKHDPRSPYCYAYDDLSMAAVEVVDRAHENSYYRYAFGAQSYGQAIMTAASGGLLDALLAPPSAPRDVEATPSCDDQIMLTWKAPADAGKVPAEFPGCASCTNRTPIHHGGAHAGITVQPGTAVITAYIIERKVDDGEWEILASDVTEMSYVDDDKDLAYGTTYHYRVRAMNNADLTGPAGNKTLTLSEPDRPKRPSSLVVNLEQGEADFELQWDPPEDTSDPKLWRTQKDFDDAKERDDFRSHNLSYLVQRQIDDGSWKSVLKPTEDLKKSTDLLEVTPPGGVKQYALRHLYSREGLSTVLTQEHLDPAISRGTQAQDVRYRVSALVNACNPSPWNQADEVEIPAAAAPGMPTGLTPTPMGPNRIDLTWTAPANNGGSPITGYTFEYSTDGGATWSDPAATDSMTTHSHTGLTAGTTYHYRVTAKNVIGSSPASATRMATTAAAPTLGSATGLTAAPGTAVGTVELTWTAGANSTRHWLAGVKVSDWSARDFSNVIFMATSGQSSHTVTGLDSGEQYAFTVLSGNATSWHTAWTPIQYATPN